VVTVIRTRAEMMERLLTEIYTETWKRVG